MTEMINVALLYPGLGLALSESKQPLIAPICIPAGTKEFSRLTTAFTPNPYP